ncbi:hypothetical protein [Streptomyces sp. 142MFCol3.1]|uniref:hypothetical protein n=1 Tax=Streptomyces sp. 142MFCol3.1 TaxID=1172179 RepID=UPI0003F9508F|nr:hypothetical protein [Streptomyces sp. 142MFCol3.1]
MPSSTRVSQEPQTPSRQELSTLMPAPDFERLAGACGLGGFGRARQRRPPSQ